MSHLIVTLLMVDTTDNVTVNDLNVWLRDNGGGFLNFFGHHRPKHVAPGPAAPWGGYKAANVDVWGGVLNTLDGRPIRSHIARMPWREPDCVQLLMQAEEDMYFHLWMIRQRQMDLYTPEEETGRLGWH